MPKTYKISAENAVEIEEIRKTITDKKVDRRLYAVQLRGEGLTNDEIAQKLDTSNKMVSQWVSAYINNGGISALLPKERIGMHRNLSIEEEKEFLSAYTKQAEAGQIIDLNELKAAYIEKSWSFHWRQSDLSNVRTSRLAQSNAKKQTSTKSKR